MADPYLNSYLTHEGKRYDIYWTSQYAQHVLENYRDPLHGVTHTEIARIIRRARFIFPKQGRGRQRADLHVCLSALGGELYESYVLLLPELNDYPARCVVITCYKCRRPDYIALFASPVKS
jgi:hypothetical protein